MRCYKEDFIIGLLIDLGDLKKVGLEKLEITKPGHGSCCTCQECGYQGEKCICDHNELVDLLNNNVIEI